MLERAKNTLLIVCCSTTTHFAFAAFLLITSLFVVVSSPAGQVFAQTKPVTAQEPATVFGYRDFSKQRAWDQTFLAVPNPARAEQHLKILTTLPHIAGSVQDRHTAEYVAKQFKVAGLDT